MWENFLLQGQLSVLTVILVSGPPQQQVKLKDPSQSAKRAGAKHTCTQCIRVALHEVTLSAVAWFCVVHRICAETDACGTSHVLM